MKTKSKNEAKKLAKAYSHHKDYKDIPVYIIYCNRTECFYIDDNGLIRLGNNLLAIMSTEFILLKNPFITFKATTTVMKVTDLNGYQIEVTDFDEAIRITREYKE